MPYRIDISDTVAYILGAWRAGAVKWGLIGLFWLVFYLPVKSRSRKMPTDEELAARFGEKFPQLLADERRMFRSTNQIDNQKWAHRQEVLLRIRTHGFKWVAAGAVTVFSLSKLRT